MRKKVIIFFVIICILSISCISILTYCKPIKIENIDKSKEYMMNYILHHQRNT